MFMFDVTNKINASFFMKARKEKKAFNYYITNSLIRKINEKNLFSEIH